MFTAYKGKGSYLNGKKIKIKSSKDICIIYKPTLVSPWSKKQLINIVKKLIDIGNLRSYGSAGLHYAYVACGRAQAVVSCNKDTFPEFAGKLLVEEAGG